LASVKERDRVYVDETGCDERLQREHGWSVRGTPCFGTRAGRGRERRSVVAAWQRSDLPDSDLPDSDLPDSDLLAPLSFEGTCHHRLFELWLRVMLSPKLRTGQVVILDNARFHRKKAVERILRKVGCRALFLPSYSPDLNPIEQQWHPFKTRVRTNRIRGMDFKQAFETALL